jgi:hypothetical protein
MRVPERGEPIDRGRHRCRRDAEATRKVARAERSAHDEVLHRLEIRGIYGEFVAQRLLECVRHLEDFSQQAGRLVNARRRIALNARSRLHGPEFSANVSRTSNNLSIKLIW